MMNEKLGQLRVKLFFDGASLADLRELGDSSYIKGFTTNPTLIRKAGINDYQDFAREMIALVPDRPISFGVCSDDFKEMERQALHIASWAKTIYVKIPIINTQRETCYELVKKLAAQKVKVNVTAVMTEEQIRQVLQVLSPDVPAYISLFAGRIADTGRDPSVLMKKALELIKDHPLVELIWASPRELLNIFQADELGCHIITLTKDIISKLPLIGYNLEEYALDTVKMFYNDALAAGLKLAY
ncbi:Transaldolase [Legionella massiliensis]|uniref:Transaldolase n=1 Tax=Legionella massiliensis TaxID=1034943 RepID=A0A078L0Q7_9GAMM|nr:transaldolase [Legionella massiliensis]CDZ77598.1 Transaldolase [Legionella massiliensis]CEE13336.1 Transaldolase [Legionella massiliensis]